MAAFYSQPPTERMSNANRKKPVRWVYMVCMVCVFSFSTSFSMQMENEWESRDKVPHDILQRINNIRRKYIHNYLD